MKITKQYFTDNMVVEWWETQIGYWIEVNGKDANNELEKAIRNEMDDNSYLYGECDIDTECWQSANRITVLSPTEVIDRLNNDIEISKQGISRLESNITKYESLLAQYQAG